MEACVGLVVGSHNCNELIVICCYGKSGPKPLQQISRQICQICSDDVGLTANDELFVACNKCAFPICRTCCYPLVAGDEEEDDVDDLENEFNFVRRDKQDG